jgi:hypothetical protein
MKIKLIAIFVFLSLFGFSQNNEEKEIYNNISFLASEQLKGRKIGTPEGLQAAEFIKKQFVKAGLKLLCSNGFQDFEVVTDIKAGSNNSLSFDGSSYVYDKDFAVFSFSSNANLENEIVFAGYGYDLNTDSLKWNDYKDIDVKGKWVMVFLGNPEQEKSNSRFEPFSSARTKTLTAKDKGAAGVIFVNPVFLDKNDQLVALNYDKSSSNSEIPVINIKRTLANTILLKKLLKVEDLEKEIIKTKTPKSFYISEKINVSTELKLTKAKAQNVVGILEGSDPKLKDEYIVVGAHYDHLGMGGEGSGTRKMDTVAVHNGADDNASGVAAVIETAEKIKGKKLKRSVIFVAFDGEEAGLLGSGNFVKKSPVDIKKIDLMINFDMVGRFNETTKYISVGGTGTFADAEVLLKKDFDTNVIKLAFSPEGYGPSDHASFYSENIPVLYFSTGTHPDYHLPEDDTDKINVKGLKKIIDFSSIVLSDIANTDNKLIFKEAGPKNRSSQRSGLKVTLGLMPDFAAGEVKGLKVGGVNKAGPADKGGMLKGDIIVAIDGKSVTNIYDYMDRLKVLSSGQLVSVDVLRNNEKVILIIQL